MYDRILFPTDGSEAADATFEHVLDIASDGGATVQVLFVADTSRDSSLALGGDVVDVLGEQGAEFVTDLVERAEERGVEAEGEVLQGDPHGTIVEYAATNGTDLIAMATHGRRGLERFLLGSVTERVVRRSPVPVLTMRPDERIEYPYANVLVPTDGSDTASVAVEHGATLAKSVDATLHLLSAVDMAGFGIDVRSEVYLDQFEEVAREAVEEGAGVARDAGVDDVLTAVDTEGVHDAVLDYVDENDVDLVVMGTHGRTGFDRYLLGSVTEKVLRTSPVPVLTVREPRE